VVEYTWTIVPLIFMVLTLLKETLLHIMVEYFIPVLAGNNMFNVSSAGEGGGIFTTANSTLD